MDRKLSEKSPSRLPARASAYRVACVDEQGQAFSFSGIFRSDWDAIDRAIALGAIAARPCRLRPAH